MTRISAPWLDRPETQAVCRALTGAGHQALFVGGCVRNTLLGEKVGDIDLCTDALPETVIDLTRAAGLKPVPTGIEHGTITVVSGGIPHEVTTFRHDVETDGRRAVVAFATDVTEDARRRDFTMNALYADPEGQLIDPLNGLPDLHARRVRFIEDPSARITEDYLRILRFFRFHAWYGDPEQGLDAEGLAACAALADGLEQLSKERVGAEMRKLLAARDPAPSVASMAASGCLARVLPGADAQALPILVAQETALGVAPDAIRRLAVLGGSDQVDRLRLSRREGRQLETILTELGSMKSAAELAYRHGSQAAMDILLARAAMLEMPVFPSIRVEIDRGAAARFPVSAADLTPEFAGAALGARLKELEARWIASGFALDKAALLA